MDFRGASRGQTKNLALLSLALTINTCFRTKKYGISPIPTLYHYGVIEYHQCEAIRRVSRISPPFLLNNKVVKNVKNLAKVKKGDAVLIRRTEALLLEVAAPQK